MSTFTGKDGVVKFDNNEVLEVRDFSIEQTANRVDDTVMGDEWMTGKVTQKSWTASVNVYYDPTEISAANMQIGKTVSVDLYPQGEGTGLRYFTGNADITSVSVNQSFDGMIEASLSLEGVGALTYTA